MTGIKCRNCISYKNDWCKKVTDSPDPDIVRTCQYFKEETNGDRIRSMSNEELAQFIPNWSYTDACKCGEHYVDCNNECEKCVAEWLQQPAEEV